MKIFPIVCLLSVVAFYIIASRLVIRPSTPPIGAIVHHEPNLQRIPAAPTANKINAAAAAVEVAPPTTIAAPTPAAAASAAPKTVLDGTLDAALRAAVPSGKPKFVLATFGNLGVKEQLRNFVTYCAKAGAPHVIGAVDVGAFDLMTSLGSPAYKTPLASEDYKLDGSNQHSSGSWKRFASMRTGEVMKIVNAGYTVLHTDCDVVFLRDPSPYLMCDSANWGDEARYPCAGLAPADVAVSSDNMSPDRDHRGHAGYSAGGTFNTGLLLVRATEGGKRFVNEWHKLVVSPPRGEFAILTSDQQVFNHMFRKPMQWPGIAAKEGAWLMEGRDMGLNVKLGALPLTLFINGHGYFVQSAHKRLKVDPIAVHATYSLDNHDALAKAQRFREAGMWQVDNDAYYAGKYLALNHSISPSVQAAVDKYVKRGEAPSNIDVHSKALASYVAELRDALALAHSLQRTLILPRWTCYCDRLWSGSDDIFHFGCMYPGAQDGKFVPFVCPMDHVLSPTVWSREGHPYRDAAFLESPRRAGQDAVVDLRLLPRNRFEALEPAATRGALPLGTTDGEARSLLQKQGLDKAGVLRLPHARGLLCGMESASDASALNRLSQRLLKVPQWCAKCFQPCKEELAKWLGPNVGGSSLPWGMGGGNYYCLDVPLPPAFKHGECVANVRE